MRGNKLGAITEARRQNEISEAQFQTKFLTVLLIK